MVSEKDKERYAAFVAVKCAAQTAQAQLCLAQIVGAPTTTTQSLTQEARIDIPQFMVRDRVGDYVIGEQRRVYKGMPFIF